MTLCTFSKLNLSLRIIVPAVPTAAPESITESAIDSRTLLISWAPPPLPARNGIITEYVVNVSVMETGEQFGRTAPGSATSLSIASLHPDYTYTYVVAALTAVGSGPISTFRSIKMPEDGEKLNKYCSGNPHIIYCAFDLICGSVFYYFE